MWRRVFDFGKFLKRKMTAKERDKVSILLVYGLTSVILLILVGVGISFPVLWPYGAVFVPVVSVILGVVLFVTNSRIILEILMSVMVTSFLLSSFIMILKLSGWIK